MFVGDFLDLYKKDQEAAIQTINVQEYIGFYMKKNYIEQLVDMLVEFDEGIAVYNSLDEYFLFTIGAISLYSDLEFSSEDDVAYFEYDELLQAGALSEIMSKFEYDYRTLYELFKNRMNDILRTSNSLELRLVQTLSRLDSAITESLSQIDLDKITALAGMISREIEK